MSSCSRAITAPLHSPTVHGVCCHRAAQLWVRNTTWPLTLAVGAEPRRHRPLDLRALVLVQLYAESPALVRSGSDAQPAAGGGLQTRAPEPGLLREARWRIDDPVSTSAPPLHQFRLSGDHQSSFIGTGSGVCEVSSSFVVGVVTNPARRLSFNR